LRRKITIRNGRGRGMMEGMEVEDKYKGWKRKRNDGRDGGGR